MIKAQRRRGNKRIIRCHAKNRLKSEALSHMLAHNMSLISIVIPVYNEQDCLPALYDRLHALQQSSADSFEFIFVDDGSTDDSRKIIRAFADRRPDVKHIFFSRNFGHEMATTAGLDHAGGDAVVIIDADLQDPPEMIPSLIEEWHKGSDVVYARRLSRHGETIWKRFSAWLFYRIIRSLTDVDIPSDTGDFRLMDRRVVEHLRQCREHSRFIRGLVAWTGFRQTAVSYARDIRHAGKGKYNAARLIMLAFDAVLGFSNVPLRLGILLGAIVCLTSVGLGLSVIVQKLWLGLPIPGYALLVTGVYFLGGVQLFMLGLVGEYVGRAYRDAQRRPLYVIAEKSAQLVGHPLPAPD